MPAPRTIIPRPAHLALVLALAALAAGTFADPPVRVNVDVHLGAPAVEAPGPAVVLPPEPERRDHGHRHHRHHDGAPAYDRDARPGDGDDFHVPPDRVPGHGLCRIWFDDLPPDRQPPAMSCERAHHVARRHGGRVIWTEPRHGPGDGRVASASYGRVDFSGVPPDRLPPPGSCRVWLDGVPPDRQPPPTSCARAERDAARVRGRVLFMPGP